VDTHRLSSRKRKFYLWAPHFADGTPLIQFSPHTVSPFLKTRNTTEIGTLKGTRTNNHDGQDLSGLSPHHFGPVAQSRSPTGLNAGRRRPQVWKLKPKLKRTECEGVMRRARPTLHALKGKCTRRGLTPSKRTPCQQASRYNCRATCLPTPS